MSQGGADSVGKEIARSPGDAASDQQAEDYGAGFHEGRAKSFAHD